MKNKIYSFINIGGLAIGLAACIAIGLYVQDEYAYDRFHQNFEHIYRVTEIQKQPDGLHPVAVTPGPLGPTLVKDFAEIAQYTRVGQWSTLLQLGQNIVAPKTTLVVENSFFQLFDFKLLAGDKHTVFLKPDEIILTEETTMHLFGPDWRKAAVIGTNVKISSDLWATIVGVVANAPAASHLQFDVLLPFKSMEKYDEWSNRWNSNNYHTYLLLKPETNVGAFEAKLAKQLPVYDQGNEATLCLQPLSRIYLHSAFDFQTDFGKRSNIFYVRIFLAVGLIVLLIAIFNFINLSTARSSRRAQEVGVRKSVGANRQSLIVQFLSEALLMTSLSVGLALLLSDIAVPLFNNLTDKKLAIPFGEPSIWLVATVATLSISLFAGAYPAFLLSSFRPSKVLKGVFDKKSGVGFRASLVLGQFVLSVALVIGTVVIYEQLKYIQNKNLGFDQSQLLYLRLKGAARDKAWVMKDQLSALPSISSATATTSNLVDVSNSSTFEWENQKPAQDFLITQMNVDADFVKTTGMTIVSGRNFSNAIAGDTTDKFGRYLVNETTAQRMGFNNETIIGKKVKFWGLEGEVIGVVKNFHFQPLNNTIDPFIFRFRPKEFYFNILLKTSSNDIDGTVAAVEKIYRSIDPENPIDYGFVDQDLEKQYRSEQRTGKIVLYFSFLAILISCLGLFGLAAFTAEQRTKEIGVRKVLGASVAGITTLLAKDFLKLVVLAILIASPIAYYCMNQWLADFAYRIEMQPWIFAVAGLSAVSIAFLTVGFQAVKAAVADPVKSLRSE